MYGGAFTDFTFAVRNTLRNIISRTTKKREHAWTNAETTTVSLMKVIDFGGSLRLSPRSKTHL